MLLHTMDNFGKPWILPWRQLTLPLGFAVVLLFTAIGQAQEQTPPLLVVISVDGMRPDYVTEADARGAKVPNLRRFLKEGTYAEGVVGVVPTVTYPSHTTRACGQRGMGYSPTLRLIRYNKIIRAGIGTQRIFACLRCGTLRLPRGGRRLAFNGR